MLWPAERIEVLNVSVAAGVPTLTPQTNLFTIPPGHVTGVEIRFPPGGRGLTGVALRQAGQQVIPRTPGAYVIDDDTTLTWALAHFALTSQWSAISFNTHTVAHAIHVRLFLVEVVRRPDPELADFLPLPL